MSDYFDRPRREILPYLPQRCLRVLDVGCGAGATLSLVRERVAPEWIGGVEPNALAAGHARDLCDRLWEGGVEAAELEAEIPRGTLDLVLCLDVLEHLVDPWAEVRRLSALLGAGGRLIVSVPNIRNWKFIWRLLAKGDFHYTDAGLLDRTHLRFFTPETAVELALSGGLALVHAGSATAYGRAELRRWLIRASAGRLESLIAKQTLVVAERPAA